MSVMPGVPKTSGTILIVIVTVILLGYTGFIYMVSGYSYYTKLAPFMSEGFQSMDPHQFSRLLPGFIIHLFGGASSFLLGILSLVSSIGLILFKNWGRALLLLTLLVNLIYICIIPAVISFIIQNVLLGGSESTHTLKMPTLQQSDYITIIIALLLMLYFSKKTVKEQFSDY
ncbi:MAG: hypothetical protein JXD21_00260 [Candidatus Omnitrophica bacterium]|nr:hypothetical protein [Candidatus Omnitrophota bacterium]